MRNFGKTLIVVALTAFTATSALAFDRPGNPPGPVGGPGTNWHNPPGPVGGPGFGPSAHHRVLKRAIVHHHRHHLRHQVHFAAPHGQPGPHR